MQNPNQYFNRHVIKLIGICSLLISVYIVVVTISGLIVPHEILKPTDSSPLCTLIVPPELPIPAGPIPLVKDWRETGFVRNIMNQAKCNVCWGFSIFQMMETMVSILHATFIKLSVLDLWESLPGMQSCGMKNQIKMLSLMKLNNIAILTSECYRATKTKDSVECTHRVGIQDFTCLKCPFSNLILHAVAKIGPVMAVINSNGLRNTTGIITDGYNVCKTSSIVPTQPCCGCCRRPSESEPALTSEKVCGDLVCSEPSLNHVVVIVGYNLTAPTPYYIVRSTYGEEVGDKGYFYIAIGNNNLGIETSIVYLHTKEYGHNLSHTINSSTIIFLSNFFCIMVAIIIMKIFH